MNFKRALAEAGIDINTAPVVHIYNFVFDLFIDELERHPVPLDEDPRDNAEIADERTEAWIARNV